MNLRMTAEAMDALTQVNASEMVIVPKGVRHRPVVGALARFLMGTLNKENSGDLL